MPELDALMIAGGVGAGRKNQANRLKTDGDGGARARSKFMKIHLLG
jgi:hypothetical protein